MAKKITLEVNQTYIEHYQVRKPAEAELIAAECFDPDDINGSISEFFSSDLEGVLEGLSPLIRTRDDSELEEVYSGSGSATSAELPPLAAADDDPALLVVTARVTYSETYIGDRPTKAEVVDADFEWDADNPESSIRDYIADDLDSWIGGKTPTSAERGEVEFEEWTPNTAALDASAAPVPSPEFHVRTTSVALVDLPFLNVNAGQERIFWLDSCEKQVQEGDPCCNPGRFTKTKARRHVERIQKEQELELRLRRFREPEAVAKVQNTVEVVPAAPLPLN